MVKTSFRIVAIMNKDKTIHLEFSEDKKESHRNLWDKIKEKDTIDRDYDCPIYGRFYVLLYANSKRPQLIIYGSSSDYDIEKLGHYQDYYENAIRKLAFDNKWDMLFLS